MVDSINSMLDGSLLADNSYETTFEMTQEHNNEINFSISSTFHNLLLNGNLVNQEPVREFFSSYSSFYEHEKAADLVEEADIATFSGDEYLEDYQSYYNTLAKSIGNRRPRTYGEGNYLADILFDELVFSMERSPILSRLKKTANSLRNTVAYTIEISEERLDENWKNLQQEVGRRIDDYNQLKEQLQQNAEDRLEDDDPILLSTYLRQIIKDYAPNWIIHISNRYLTGVAGALVGGYIGGTAGGAAGALVAPGLQDLVMYIADP